MSKVLVNFIQDRSGSMQSVWDETLNGFKTFVENLQNDKDSEFIFTLTTFDTVVETPFVAQPIADIPTDALKAHGPRGSTALYDAVGKTLDATKGIVADKYIVVVVTDGQENSSREWTKTTLQKAIEDKIKSGNWTFTYLGTQPETWDEAAKIGIIAGSTATYTPGTASRSYNTMSASISNFSKSAQLGTQNLVADFVSDEDAKKSDMKKAAPAAKIWR
jgi:von Willebrand factor type A domain